MGVGDSLGLGDNCVKDFRSTWGHLYSEFHRWTCQKTSAWRTARRRRPGCRELHQPGEDGRLEQRGRSGEWGCVTLLHSLRVEWWGFADGLEHEQGGQANPSNDRVEGPLLNWERAEGIASSLTNVTLQPCALWDGQQKPELDGHHYGKIRSLYTPCF